MCVLMYSIYLDKSEQVCDIYILRILLCACCRRHAMMYRRISMLVALPNEHMVIKIGHNSVISWSVVIIWSFLGRFLVITAVVSWSYLGNINFGHSSGRILVIKNVVITSGRFLVGSWSLELWSCRRSFLGRVLVIKIVVKTSSRFLVVSWSYVVWSYQQS